MWSNATRISACVYLCLTGAGAAAQSNSTPGAPPLELAEALERTLARSPELAAAGYTIAAAEGRLEQVGLAPNPELEAVVEDALGTDEFTGVDSTETTVTLGWILERGKRARRAAAARSDLSLRTVDVEIVRIDAAAETARRFVDCLAYQARLGRAGEAVALAEQTVAAVGERVAAGSALEAELSRARADLARAELRHEDYEHELESAYHRLSAQWGETEPGFASVAGDVQALPRSEPFEALLARVDDNPELERFLTRQRVDESQFELARARSRPSWRISAGLRRFERTDDIALVGGVTIPLPLNDRNEGRIAEARADLARTRAEADAARVRIETELFVLYQELRHNLQLAGRLRADVIPALENALSDTRRAYDLGRYGYLEWRAVQGELLDTRDELLEAAIDAHRIVIEIERLTGTQFASAVPAQGG